MNAFLWSEIRCSWCGFSMESTGWPRMEHLRCRNPNCAFHGVRYAPPRILLERLPEPEDERGKEAGSEMNATDGQKEPGANP